jgi:two-component system response regulator YesN
MYKLMIVDDEQIVIDAITHIVKKSIKDVRITAYARSGREAIEKAREHQPDIILMDIRMPGINGIDAISEIRRCQPDIKYAIISAYEQFEFAKQAMELGVEHYIIKPINKTILVNTIMKMATQIFEEENKKKKELENMEKLDKALPYLEHGFIYSILLNTEFNEELVKYSEILDVSCSGGYIMILQFGEGDKSTGLSGKIASNIIWQENYPYIRDVFKFKCRCVVGPVLVNRVIVYVSCGQIKDEYEFRLQTIELSEEILEGVQERIKAECFIGIGGYKNNQEIIYSYEEAVKALRQNRGESVLHIMDVCCEQSAHFREIAEIDNLIGKINLGDEDGATAIFYQITDKINGNCELDFDKRKNILVEYMVIVHRKAIEAGVCEDTYLNYDDYIKEMLFVDNAGELTIWCVNRIRYITKKIQTVKSEKGNYIVERAKEYIKENFYKEIALEELSRILNISPQYFSRLFKEQTGYNFIEYLTFIRIERSKQLMNSTNMTIKEICYSVGYGDPNYFSRLFKKNTGISPTCYATKNR